MVKEPDLFAIRYCQCVYLGDDGMGCETVKGFLRSRLWDLLEIWISSVAFGLASRIYRLCKISKKVGSSPTSFQEARTTIPSPFGKAAHFKCEAEGSWSAPRGSSSTHSFPSQSVFSNESWLLTSDWRTDLRREETHSSEDWMNFLSLYEANEFRIDSAAHQKCLAQQRLEPSPSPESTMFLYPSKLTYVHQTHAISVIIYQQFWSRPCNPPARSHWNHYPATGYKILLNFAQAAVP